MAASIPWKELRPPTRRRLRVLDPTAESDTTGFQARRKLEGVSNRTVNMDVGALRKVLKRYGHWHSGR